MAWGGEEICKVNRLESLTQTVDPQHLVNGQRKKSCHSRDGRKTRKTQYPEEDGIVSGASNR